MRETGYPLQAAHELRAQTQRSAQEQLALVRAQLAAAQAALVAVQEAQAALQTQRALPRGRAVVSGEELARQGAYARGLAAQHARLAQKLAAAATELRRCKRAEREAELALDSAHVDHEVLERHHARFDAAQRKLAERDAHDEADDQAATRAHGKR